jgi:hypothetical protein
VTPWRWRSGRQLGCRAEAGPRQLQREVSRRGRSKQARSPHLQKAMVIRLETLPGRREIQRTNGRKLSKVTLQREAKLSMRDLAMFNRLSPTWK